MVSEAIATALAPFVIKHGEDAVIAAVRQLERVCKPGEAHMQEANALVNGDRQADYGSPADSYRAMAMLWSGLLGAKLVSPLTAQEAALMMVALKLQREVNKHKTDNLVDAHGYLLVLAHIIADGPEISST